MFDIDKGIGYWNETKILNLEWRLWQPTDFYPLVSAPVPDMIIVLLNRKQTNLRFYSS